MASLRLAAWVLVAMALALLGADVITSAEMGQPVVRTTREILNLMPGVAIDPDAPPPWLRLVVDLPLWGVVGVLGLLATLLVRPVD
ncbi:MAG: hypothetical protein AAF830_10810 [Pseudomonadota bacterium]